MTCNTTIINLSDYANYYRGDDWSIPLNFIPIDPDDTITWSTITFTLVDPTDLNTAVIQVEATIVDTLNAVIEVPHTDTEAIDIKTYNYDIERINALTEVTTIMSWDIEVLQDYTVPVVTP